MSAPLEVLQARVERQAVVTVTFNYYPGAHWDCEMRTIKGYVVCTKPARHWRQLITEAIRQLEAQP